VSACYVACPSTVENITPYCGLVIPGQQTLLWYNVRLAPKADPAVYRTDVWGPYMLAWLLLRNDWLGTTAVCLLTACCLSNGGRPDGQCSLWRSISVCLAVCGSIGTADGDCRSCRTLCLVHRVKKERVERSETVLSFRVRSLRSKKVPSS